MRPTYDALPVPSVLRSISLQWQAVLRANSNPLPQQFFWGGDRRVGNEISAVSVPSPYRGRALRAEGLSMVGGCDGLCSPGAQTLRTLSLTDAIIFWWILRGDLTTE